jgi:anti-anti-sigma factor
MCLICPTCRVSVYRKACDAVDLSCLRCGRLASLEFSLRRGPNLRPGAREEWPPPTGADAAAWLPAMTVERVAPRDGSPGGALCEVKTARQGTTTTITVSGEIDIESVDQLRVALDAALAGAETLVIDLCEVGFLDSTGVRVLLEAEEAADGSPTRLVLMADADGPVERILALCGLSDRVPLIHDTASHDGH